MKALYYLACLAAASIEGVAADDLSLNLMASRDYHRFQGDMLYRVSGKPGLQGVFKSRPSDYWPNGVVPYAFHANVSAANQAQTLLAMAMWQTLTNQDLIMNSVQFVVRTTEKNFILISSNATENSSEVGMIGDGEQDLWITSWGSVDVIAHELGHSLGLHHEHSRLESIGNIEVQTQNIQAGEEDNFELEIIGAKSYGPYDFLSLMHYDKCAFSIDCAVGSSCSCSNITIKTVDPSWQDKIGQSTRPSVWDQITVSFLYAPSDWVFVDNNAEGDLPFIGTFWRPLPNLPLGEVFVPAGGQIFVLSPGTYSAQGKHVKACTIRAPLGGVVLR